MRYLLILLLLFFSSCIQMIGDPEPVHYYLIEGLQKETETYSDKNLTIDIQLVNFPNYLDRLQIITQQNSTVKFSEHDRWAEPLQGNLEQVLRENLRILLPIAKITVSPWENSSTESIHIKIMVNKFSGKLGEHTDIDIRWAIEMGSGKVRQGHLTDQQPVGDTYQELVAGLNVGINNFSLELAKDLARE
ncbi:MAG: membrane integrity-associated transporter subunit PqiC [Anaerolineales bacterium]|nr:membrane integrity-associated transporter subunit PqiC [Anaerolineales bacterium]